MMTVHTCAGQGAWNELKPSHQEKVTFYLKGAPEIIVKMCGTYLFRGKEMPISETLSAHFDEVYQEIAKQGERVLGLAKRDLPLKEWERIRREVEEDKGKIEELVPVHGFVFLGLMSLVDPPKPGVAEAVLRCKQAGVRVMMITVRMKNSSLIILVGTSHIL